MVSKAEFILNEAGEVAKLGLILEPEMGDAKIWYIKEVAIEGECCFFLVEVLYYLSHDAG